MYPRERYGNTPDSVIFRFGIYPYKMKILQSWLQVGAIFDLIETEQIKTFIEVGVYEGGFGSLVSAKSFYDKEFRYFGIEIDSSVVNIDFIDQCRKAGNLIFFGDVFDNFTLMRKIISESKGPVLLFCDGGDKVKEMKTFYSFMRIGDIIMCHDYMPELTPAIGSVLDTDIEFLTFNDNFDEVSGYRWKYRMPAFRCIAKQ